MSSHPLAAHMEAQNLSQSALARLSGVPRENINRVLRKKRPRFSVTEAGKIARVTGISALALLGLPAADPAPTTTPKRSARRVVPRR